MSTLNDTAWGYISPTHGVPADMLHRALTRSAEMRKLADLYGGRLLGCEGALITLGIAYGEQAKENADNAVSRRKYATELQAIADALGVPYSSGEKVLQLVKDQAARLRELEEDKARLDWLLHRYSFAGGRSDAKDLHWGLWVAGRAAIDQARGKTT